MPLHLLGKKSWNVYNADNISRVRKDEAEAQAREEAAEQRMQEEDAARRIAILRGETVPDLPVESVAEQRRDDWRARQSDDTYAARDRKRKRRRGEDDTDRDIRYAREDRERGQRARESVQQNAGHDAEPAPLHDHAGHIQLFAPPNEMEIRARQKNEEAEAEKAKKRRREEDLVTMRFRNAAGYDQGMQQPWYAASADARPAHETAASRNEVMLAELQGKDVWGNDDPRRQERETKRIVSSDPFAMMQNAQRQLKQSKRDKEEWDKKRRTELHDLASAQRRSRRQKDDGDSRDGFSLDAPRAEEGRSKHRHRHRSRRSPHEHRRHSTRGGSRERERSRSKDRDRHDRRRRSG